MIDEKTVNLTTGRQPERMLPEEIRSLIEDTITGFCGDCGIEGSEDGDACESCIMNRFSDYIIPKSSVMFDGKRIWIPDDTRFRFIYSDGSIFEYSLKVIDITHVELRRTDGNEDDRKYGVLTLHVNQLESMIRDPEATAEVRTGYEKQDWKPIREAIG